MNNEYLNLIVFSQKKIERTGTAMRGNTVECCEKINFKRIKIRLAKIFFSGIYLFPMPNKKYQMLENSHPEWNALGYLKYFKHKYHKN